MGPKTLGPEERAYLREVMASSAGRKWIGLLIAMRPPIGGASAEERGLSASEALGYERAVSNLGLTLEEAASAPELKSIEIRTD